MSLRPWTAYTPMRSRAVASSVAMEPNEDHSCHEAYQIGRRMSLFTMDPVRKEATMVRARKGWQASVQPFDPYLIRALIPETNLRASAHSQPLLNDSPLR